MARYAFDIETNGLLDELDRVHCIVTQDLDTGEVTSCADQPGYTPLSTALDQLAGASLIAAHNAIGFDVPALKMVYPDWTPKGTVRDTLLMSRLQFPDIGGRDNRLVAEGKLPNKLRGRYSLESWGHRLGLHKGDYSAGWGQWSTEMHEYCEQDVRVLAKLWRMLMKRPYAESAVQLEHDFAEITRLIELGGFNFDEEAAVALYSKLSARRAELEAELCEVFPPRQMPMKLSTWTAGGKTYQSKKEAVEDGHKAKDVEKGEPRMKTIPYNPGSREDTARRLIEKYHWKPTVFTPKGTPQMDESIVSELVYPEAKVYGEYLMVAKRIGALAEGAGAWLKLAKGGKIHGRITTAGAVTRRCTHSKPNVSQVPAVRKPYGAECRALFGPPEGMVLVGADASGIELRMLAHYLHTWDGGAYAKVVTTGDVHAENMRAAGLDDRDVTKTFVYAFIYGASDTKLGTILGGGPKLGKTTRERLLNNIPALAKLKDAIAAKVASTGTLVSLDGGAMQVRSAHSALNTLLQSAGAIAFKRATTQFVKLMSQSGFEWEYHYRIVAHVHDEIQVACGPGIADIVGSMAVQSIVEAGKALGVRCPLDGEYKIGRNWAETH